MTMNVRSLEVHGMLAVINVHMIVDTLILLQLLANVEAMGVKPVDTYKAIAL